MSAELVMQPGRQFASAGDFFSECPPYSIGIEVVDAPPQVIQQPDGPYAIIDHHTGVVRRVTQAACEQAWGLVGLGLVDQFTGPDGDYHPTVYARDPDQDTNLAYHIVNRAGVVPQLTAHEIERIEELVHVEGMLDRFGGVPPGRITPKVRRMMERIAWIFDAYSDYRSSGELYRNNPEDHVTVMREGSRRIRQHVNGHGRSRPLDTRYNTVGQQDGCALIERVGAEALLGACSDGFLAVIVWQPRADGNHQYTYYRRSALVPFRLDKLYAACNAEENCPPGQGHGGSDNIGGSPIELGSTIPPERLLRILAQNPRILAHRTPDAGTAPNSQ